MAKSTIIPFGPQHPVLPEPIHLDLEIEDEIVKRAIPQIGFIHRGLEKLVEHNDYNQFVYIAERACGICSMGHALGYSMAVEKLLNVEIPQRAEFLRAIWHELSRMHSHIMWLGLCADAFGFESLFMHSWRIREKILEIFEITTGARIIFGAIIPGGVSRDISNAVLSDIKTTLNDLKLEYNKICKSFLNDSSIKNRTVDVGKITHKQALDLSMVGPFARASGVNWDVRNLKSGAYSYLEDFEPVIDNQGDCYSRIKVRCAEVYQSIDIICELINKIPDGDVLNKINKLTPEDEISSILIEQPRGEAYYFVKGNGTKFLDRFRLRTPTSQNLSGLIEALKGCSLSDVNMIILTIDPCISCTER